MNNTKLPEQFGKSLVMGAFIMLTSAGVIAIMSAF
jgi:hypothetical protein